ncbi:hypothetical protein [Rhodoferax lacus]|nr:hypothetical protein [Rhodoferax lacus]
MNIALVLQHKLVLGIQRLMQGSSTPLLAAPARMVRSHVRPSVAYSPLLTVARTGNAGATASRLSAEKVMPLRVLRVVETGMPRTSTGRLVISGRMADVCAELDRLVEREAALH